MDFTHFLEKAQEKRETEVDCSWCGNIYNPDESPEAHEFDMCKECFEKFDPPKEK